MSEVICINGQFTNDQLEFWAKYNVKCPEQDKLYTIRDVVRNTDGSIGLHLEEIHNPTIPINHPILGVAMIEPNFDINRFRQLDGSPLNATELMSIFRVQIQTVKIKNYDNVFKN